VAARAAARSGGSWRGRVRGLLPFVLAAAGGFLLAYAAVFVFVFPSRLVSDERPVPDVRGQLAEDAERTLREAGFASRVGAQRVNASLPPGTVSAQSPAAAVRRPRGATVVLDVAAEP
jgi:beta-lactam-binding protein with PASTA domain